MPYSITREDAAKDATAVRLILGTLPAMVNTSAIERLTELADSIEEQVKPAIEEPPAGDGWVKGAVLGKHAQYYNPDYPDWHIYEQTAGYFVWLEFSFKAKYATFDEAKAAVAEAIS